VKRGNWVVKNILGERIPPPPAVVPDLPSDEAVSDLPVRECWPQHRANPNCAACHARFDSLGLVLKNMDRSGNAGRTIWPAGQSMPAPPFRGQQR